MGAEHPAEARRRRRDVEVSGRAPGLRQRWVWGWPSEEGGSPLGLIAAPPAARPPAGAALTPNPLRGPSCPQFSFRAGTLRAFPRTRGRGDAGPARPLLQPHRAARRFGWTGREGLRAEGVGAHRPAGREQCLGPGRAGTPPRTHRDCVPGAGGPGAPSRGWAAPPGADPPFRGAGDAAGRTEPHIRPPPPRATSQQCVSVSRGSAEQLSSASSSLWAPLS